MSKAKWRTGQRIGITLYRHDVCVGSTVTPELAAELVADANAPAKATAYLRCTTETDADTMARHVLGLLSATPAQAARYIEVTCQRCGKTLTELGVNLGEAEAHYRDCAPAQAAMCRADVGGVPCGEQEPCAEHPAQAAEPDHRCPGGCVMSVPGAGIEPACLYCFKRAQALAVGMHEARLIAGDPSEHPDTVQWRSECEARGKELVELLARAEAAERRAADETLTHDSLLLEVSSYRSGMLSAESRLAEATALLERGRSSFENRDVYLAWREDSDAFLSATPAQSAQPAAEPDEGPEPAPLHEGTDNGCGDPDHPAALALRECRAELEVVSSHRATLQLAVDALSEAGWHWDAINRVWRNPDSAALESARAERDMEKSWREDKERLIRNQERAYSDLERERDTALSRIGELSACIAELEAEPDPAQRDWMAMQGRIAELEATQVSPAMVAEFEGGKAQREELRTRLDAAKTILDSWDRLETNYWAGHGDDPRYNAVRQALRDFWEGEQ